MCKNYVNSIWGSIWVPSLPLAWPQKPEAVLSKYLIKWPPLSSQSISDAYYSGQKSNHPLVALNQNTYNYSTHFGGNSEEGTPFRSWAWGLLPLTAALMIYWLPQRFSGKRICLPMQETQETRVQLLGWKGPSEKEIATYSSVLDWEIPWTEKRGRLQSTGSQRVGHDWVTKQQTILLIIAKIIISALTWRMSPCVAIGELEGFPAWSPLLPVVRTPSHPPPPASIIDTLLDKTADFP